MKTNTNIGREVIIGILLVVALTSVVSADSYQLLCLYNGQSIDFAQTCGPGRPKITAPSDGFVQVCAHNLDNGKLCHSPLNICNGLGLLCSTVGNVTSDTEPPTLSISSPVNGSVFTSRNVLIDLTASESVDIRYEKASDPGRWISLCSDCDSYAQQRSFEEGLNVITFRATDGAGNDAFYVKSFSVDSKVPKIKSFSPNSGFATGEFTVRFEEDNPEDLILHYGNLEVGFRQHLFDLDAECYMEAKDHVCTTSVNLSDYDGWQIGVDSSLSDVAGNVVQTPQYFLNVDYSSSTIGNVDYVVEGGKVTFSIEVDEPFLSAVTYIDHSENNPKEKKLCTKLVNGICNKKIGFKDGEHEVEIIVTDRAGNRDSKFVTFFTDSKKPKIKDIEPSKKFASGLFEVEFEEQNPESVTLEYGNYGTGFFTYDFVLDEDCYAINDKRTYCSKNIDLSDFEGQKINYIFTVMDIASSSAQKGKSALLVDNTFPVIDSINYTVSGKSAEVVISATEDNIDKILYLNNDDARPRESTFCSKLGIDGTCKKKIRLNEGLNRIDFTVRDEAGNLVGQRIEISI